MTALVGVEFLKPRRHLIVYLAALGALVPAAILVMVWFNLKARGFEPTTELLMAQAQLIVLLLEGPVGSAIIGSMLFGREYGDRTLPNLLISGLPRSTGLGAKWVALALVGLAIVTGAWVAAAGVTLLAVGPAAMDWRLALASLGAHLVGGLALYATGAIPVALILAFRNPMVGAAWGVVTMVAAFFGTRPWRGRSRCWRRGAGLLHSLRAAGRLHVTGPCRAMAGRAGRLEPVPDAPDGADEPASAGSSPRRSRCGRPGPAWPHRFGPGPQRRRRRGSIRSRTPSPSRLKPSTVSAMAIPGRVDIHHWSTR